MAPEKVMLQCATVVRHPSLTKEETWRALGVCSPVAACSVFSPRGQRMEAVMASPQRQCMGSSATNHLADLPDGIMYFMANLLTTADQCALRLAHPSWHAIVKLKQAHANLRRPDQLPIPPDCLQHLELVKLHYDRNRPVNGESCSRSLPTPSSRQMFTAADSATALQALQQLHLAAVMPATFPRTLALQFSQYLVTARQVEALLRRVPGLLEAWPHVEVHGWPGMALDGNLSSHLVAADACIRRFSSRRLLKGLCTYSKLTSLKIFLKDDTLDLVGPLLTGRMLPVLRNLHLNGIDVLNQSLRLGVLELPYLQELNTSCLMVECTNNPNYFEVFTHLTALVQLDCAQWEPTENNFTDASVLSCLTNLQTLEVVPSGRPLGALTQLRSLRLWGGAEDLTKLLDGLTGLTELSVRDVDSFNIKLPRSLSSLEVLHIRVVPCRLFPPAAGCYGEWSHLADIVSYATQHGIRPFLHTFPKLSKIVCGAFASLFTDSVHSRASLPLGSIKIVKDREKSAASEWTLTSALGEMQLCTEIIATKVK